MERVTVLESPVLQTLLKNLRDKGTSTTFFRQNLRRAGYLMTYEVVSKECTSTNTKVVTVLGTAPATIIDEKILQIMIMRAGAPFTEGGTKLLDELGSIRAIGVVDAKRLEAEGSLEMDIDIGSFKVPKINGDEVLIIYDPMLATGSTLVRVLKMLKKKPRKLIICSVVSTEFGLKRVLETCPDAHIYTLAIDPELDGRGFIVPGLGDCGDRAFGECG
ncbi:MAG: uracil phosphoribosyltransferase [Candidatus Woesearchaeota archaeon]